MKDIEQYFHVLMLAVKSSCNVCSVMKTLVCDHSVEAVESKSTFQQRIIFLFIQHEAHSLMLTRGQWIPLILLRRVRKHS